MKRYDLISSIAWMLLAIYISYESIQRLGINSIRDPGAGLFPLITALILSLSSALLFFKSLFSNTTSNDIWTKQTSWRNLTLVLVALFSYVAFLHLIGFLLTTFFFIFFLFRIIEPQKWPVVTLGAGAATLISYLIFELWLQAQLPEGIFLSWLAS